MANTVYGEVKSMREKTIQINRDTVFDVINIILLTIATLIFLYPLVFILSSSLSNPVNVLNREVWLYPVNFTFEAYLRVFRDARIMQGYLNTIFYAGFGILVGVTLTIMGAYPLSRKDFYGGKFLTLLFTITMFFSGGLIPLYLVVRQLGMINSFTAIVLPSAVSMFNIYITRTFLKSSIPEELCESATVDGARNITILLKIILPLSGPIIAVLVLFYGVGYWNSYFSALIFLTDPKKYPLTLILREILVQNEMQNIMSQGMGSYIIDKTQFGATIRYSIIVIASLPVLMLYPFLQRYFVKGIMIGAIKG